MSGETIYDESAGRPRVASLALSEFGMATYLLRRLLFAMMVVLAVTFLSFLLVYLAGDPARSLAGVDTNEEHLAMIRQQYGLDLPLYEQYFRFLQNALQGNLGQSYRYQVDSLPLVISKFGLTLQLASASLVLSILVALPLGILAATHYRQATDHLATTVSLLGVSTPGFWLAIILILIFADWLRVLPASGHDQGWRSLILPVIALSGYNIGLITRLVRRSLLEELRKPYVTVAHAKGQRRWVVNLHHALRNSLIPTVTVLGLQFGGMLGGSIVVETVFAWPGIGFLMIQAIRTNDLPVIRAVVLVVGLAFVAINLVVDLLYGVLDPRIRHQ
jgi:ABC-type dipeptide/oligopeptide/nickel transport system permease component